MFRFLKEKLTLPVFSVLFIAVAAIVTVQSLLCTGFTIPGIDGKFTSYNNYVIFKYSFPHLIHNQDLYLYYLDEHWDLFKYTPTFAWLMAPFHYLPDGPGLFLWNTLNSLPLLFGIWLLPFRKRDWRLGALAIVAVEWITSIQNSQANGLMAGLIVLAFALAEHKRYAWAVFLVTLSVFVKPFGVFAFAFFLFHPQKAKNGLYAVSFTALLTALPLLSVSPEQLLFLYKSWFHLLSWDMDLSVGLSVQGWLQTWFGFTPDQNHILLAGLVLLVLPLIRVSAWRDTDFRMSYLAYVLIWVIIFNHKAESPTFVIAVSGVAIWFMNTPKSIGHILLLLLTLVFTVLSPTDLFPRALRETYVQPYVLKAVPCIAVFVCIGLELCFKKYSRTVADANPLVAHA